MGALGLLYTPSAVGSVMTKSVTGSFYLTETVTLPPSSADGTRVSATLDLSAYVNVPTGQAIAIESVDFIHQVSSGNHGFFKAMVLGDACLTTQLTDLNANTTFVRADNHSLIASSGLNIGYAANTGTFSSDIYPDNFGPSALSEAFLVVNDTLYLTAGVDGAAIKTQDVNVSVRVRCRVVKLSTKDWMAIAIQSTAEA